MEPLIDLTGVNVSPPTRDYWDKKLDNALRAIHTCMNEIKTFEGDTYDMLRYALETLMKDEDLIKEKKFLGRVTCPYCKTMHYIYMASRIRTSRLLCVHHANGKNIGCGKSFDIEVKNGLVTTHPK